MLLTQLDKVGDDTSIGTLLHCFFIGFRFDIQITGYFALIPFILQCVASYFNGIAKWITLLNTLIKLKKWKAMLLRICKLANILFEPINNK